VPTIENASESGLGIKPLIIFGKYNTGKSWFLTLLCKELGLNYSRIEYGLTVHTKQLQFHFGSITNNNGTNTYGFFDTEGFHQTGPEIDSVRMEISLWAAISSIPGIIIYFVNNFERRDELVLLQLTQMIPLSQKDTYIFVIHNYSNASFNSLNSIKTQLSRNRSNIPISAIGGSSHLLSKVNGHSIRHLFLVQHNTSTNVSHNESVVKEIIKSLILVNAKILEDIEPIIQQKSNLMRLGFYNFYLNYSLVGISHPSEVSIYYRVLDNEEIRNIDSIIKSNEIDEMSFQSDIALMKYSNNQDNYRVLEIHGKIRYDQTRLKKSKQYTDYHFLDLTVINDVEVGGEPSPVTNHLYTPQAVDHVVGTRLIKNKLCIFVKLTKNDALNTI